MQQGKLLAPPMPDGLHQLLRQLSIGGRCVYNTSLSFDDQALRFRDEMNNVGDWENYFEEAQQLLVAILPGANHANPLDIVRWTESYEIAEAKDGVSAATFDSMVKDKGLPIGGYGIFEVKGAENIWNFCLAGMDAGELVKAQIAVYE